MYSHLGKDGREEVALESKRCGRKLEVGKSLILKVSKPRTSSISWRELFLQKNHGPYKSIPKHIITLDEKYVLRCLESIRHYALRATVRKFTSKVDILPDCSKLAERRLATGTISSSQTMINILKSSLLQEFSNFGRTDSLDVSESFSPSFEDSPQESSSILSSKPQKEVKEVVGLRYISASMHKRGASISSLNSSFSELSSSSTYGTLFHGMLRCTWKNGLIHHVFNVDDKEVYVANLSETESSDGKGSDYIYTFCSRRNRAGLESDVHEPELESVAKMRVSTEITFFCNNNSEIRETRFVLFVSSENPTAKTKTSSPAFRKKNKKLTRKVADILRLSRSYDNKQRPFSTIGGSSALPENNNSPNLELAAIIVKEVYSNNRKEAEIGGWGLKFLKRPSDHCSRDTGECSTSTNVLIPAGLHSRPRTGVGGPSSLTERWISGGRCDCGGWDSGCPLTILTTKSNDYADCKSVDLFIQDSKQSVPIMKMANVKKGLYYIHFQPSLSSLQVFAIAAAIIHSRTPFLRSESV